MVDPLEWTGAALGIAGWFGVRCLGNHAAQVFGFSIWVLSGVILCLWAFHEKKRGIILINAVNAVMALSTLIILL
jgi:hypothetical protein